MQETGSATAATCVPPGSKDALLCEMALPYRKTFFPLGYSVEIYANDRAVLAAAEESFGHAEPTGRQTDLQIRIGIVDREGAVCPPEPARRAFDRLFSLVADADNQALRLGIRHEFYVDHSSCTEKSAVLPDQLS